VAKDEALRLDELLWSSSLFPPSPPRLGLVAIVVQLSLTPEDSSRVDGDLKTKRVYAFLYSPRLGVWALL